MSANDALQTIPASSVETIEIITNPSAKYDPDGISGIINLNMKKEKDSGFNGIINTGVMTGDKYWASSIINYRKDKFNYYLGGDYSHKRQITESGTDRELFSDEIFYTAIRSDRTTYRDKYSIKGGLDYYLNDNNTLSLGGEYGFWGFERQLENTYHDYTTDLSTNLFKAGNDILDIENNYATIFLNYNLKFKETGHELSFDAFYSKTDNYSPYTLNEFYSDENYIQTEGIELNIHTDNISDRNYLRIKTDYVLPIKEKSKLEAGYQSEFKISNSNYFINITEIEENTQSNTIDFTENIYSGYGMYSSDFHSWQYQIGIRGEYFERNLNQLTFNKLYDYNKLNLFPTIHISKEFSVKQQVQLSYSRRITRPTDWNLNPNPVSTDSYVSETGNPDLKPDFTDAYEINHQFKFNKSNLSTELYYRKTKDPIYRTLTYQNDKMVMSYENLDNQFSSGVEIMSNLVITKWWSANASLSAYYTKIEGEISDSYYISESAVSGNGRLMSTFKFKTQTNFQFMAVYYAPGINPQGTSEQFYYFDFILKQYFLKRKLSVTFRTHNTFDTGKYFYTSEASNFNSNSFYIYEGPVFILSASYKINNYKQKKRTTADQDFDSGMD